MLPKYTTTKWSAGNPPAPQCERAEATAALFTRDGEQTNNLFDMQVGKCG